MAAKKSIKKDFSKEAMYRKIMPSISTTIDLGEEFEDTRHLEDGFNPPEHVPFNVMELIVRTKLPGIMDTLGACACDGCINESIAAALNELEPFYMVADEKSLREKAREIRAQNELRITAAAIRAVQFVMANPGH